MWLKVSLIICAYITNFFIVIPPCAKKVIFITEFAILGYKVKKKILRMKEFQHNFFRPLFATDVYFRYIFYFEHVNEVFGVMLNSDI